MLCFGCVTGGLRLGAILAICVPPSSNGDVLKPDDKHKTV
jgi:hypothetical protein